MLNLFVLLAFSDYICHFIDISKVLREKYPNTEFFLVRIFLYSDWIRIQSEYKKIRTKKIFTFGHFSRREILTNYWNLQDSLSIFENIMAKPNFPTEEYWEPSQTSKMKLFVKIVKGLQPLTNFAKSSILDIWLGTEYATAQSYVLKSEYSMCS